MLALADTSARLVAGLAPAVAENTSNADALLSAVAASRNFDSTPMNCDHASARFVAAVCCAVMGLTCCAASFCMIWSTMSRHCTPLAIP